MLTIMKSALNVKQAPAEELSKQYKEKDIIVTRSTWQEENKPDQKILKKVKKKINITKLVNETKRIIKTETAVDKIQKVQEELLNKGVL